MNEIRKIAPVAIWDNFQKLCDTRARPVRKKLYCSFLKRWPMTKGLRISAIAVETLLSPSGDGRF